MPARLAISNSNSASSWLGWGSCLLGGVIAFAWLPGTHWETLLPSFRALIFLPLFGSAFAAGWLVGLLRLKAGQAEQEGAIRSQASITGFLTALVACFAAYAASNSRLPLEVAAMLTGFGLLPCALIATIGASSAHRIQSQKLAALAASAVLPAAAVFVWPAVYVAGKLFEKPPVVIAPAPSPVVAPPPPKPRYMKPEGFDSANAWKRIVSHEDTIPNADAKSPMVLSHDEKRLAFVTREVGKRQLVVRQLYDPGPDYSLPLDDGVASIAWSPDDKRIIFLSSGSGAFWVCVPESGKLIRLPIPVLEGGQRHGLVWWGEEAVVVYPSRGDPGILSLDSLRITAAAKDAVWSKLTEDERVRIGQEAFAPDMGRNTKAKFAFIGGTGGDSRALAINDEESLYARLVASADLNFGSVFPNRDGTMFFIMEPDRLRILHMGLRQSPSLRFMAEAKESFPTIPAVSAAMEKKSVRAAVAAPIVNPLNGKTVAGDPKRIKGFARFIAANDKTCSVWIEQERQPVREGDVLINLSVIQDGDEYSASPDWWAVIKATDENQSMPRRADVTMLLPSSTRILRPLPEPAPKPPSATAERPSSVSPPQAAIIPPVVSPPPPMVKAKPPIVSPPPPAVSSPNAKKVTPPVPPSRASQVPALPASASSIERVKYVIAMHHANISDRNVDAIVADYGSLVRRNDQDLSRDQMRQRETASATHVLGGFERVDGPISVEAQQNNRYHCEYGVYFEWEHKDEPGSIQNGSQLIELDVLLTNAGPKIVLKRTRIYKMNPPKRK